MAVGETETPIIGGYTGPVYGFKPNKCKIKVPNAGDVYTKNQIDITTGNEDDWDSEQGGFELDYPDGYHKNNSIILNAAVFKNTSSGVYLPQEVNNVELGTESIWVVTSNTQQGSVNTNVSVVLMKRS